ncbi:MAG: hypothetical protein AAFZ15_13655 [Bacteroidota bacterium]
MKKNFTLLTLLALVGAGIGYKFYNQPHEDIRTVKTEVVISAKELFAAYEANETTANSKFLDKKIEVQGKVVAIEKDAEGKVGITLEAGGMMGGVICKLDHLTDHSRSEFTIGEDVVFKGICIGMLMDVVLERCVEL